MAELSVDELKRKTLDEVENSFEMLAKSFESFNRKWAEAQKAGPLDRKEMDELILESLDEGIAKTAKKK